MSDGSTDVGILENEGIYIRSCIFGEVSVCFLEMRQVAVANAEGIVQAITDTLKAFSDGTDDQTVT